ncbi:hypothetical protein GCM10010387_15680 [Streptomyces inusitatus]|uniref:Uncharacterized protein n=1 Tax=Streptomyces inusitatus TaxID=68221 RepID=A0A918PVB5_9ACTN|nr:hypothetical protein [Streptomyces inusitatus]GGZ23392.1 hypothetical protein GCM10010387_15680 [Streptomyces inusitatus]
MTGSKNDTTPSSASPSGGGSHEEPPGPLLSQRTVTIGTAAAAGGGLIGTLTYVETGSLAGAVFAGLLIFGAAVGKLHKVVGS